MNKDIYINKIYYDIATYLKVKKVNDYADAYLEINEYFSNLSRTDIETIKNELPKEFTNKEELTEEQIKELIVIINNKSKEYKEFIKNYTILLQQNLDKEMESRNFSGTYPKYYLEKENELLILEFDEDIYLKEETLEVNRQGFLIKIKNYQEVMPDFDINNFSYMSLFISYLEEIQSGSIRTFMIKLPVRDYTKELTEANVIEDIKYLEIVDCVLENKKYLPKWYINNGKTKKMIYKELFLFVLLITAFIGSFVNTLLLNGNLTSLIIIWVITGIIDHFICKVIAEKKYNKYHNIDKK